ncbi:DUF411 domain-containing protein [Advenella sp. RU8]|uniref:DUF411 domain-containing protein n=1 Tax=Advenella sp. RU8 TaxID=3399575 RepID=UPI003AAF21D8
MNLKTPLRILLLRQNLAKIILAMALLAPIVSPARSLPPITIWQTEGCNCCKHWANEMQSVGFELNINTVPDTTAYRRQLGIPDEMASCQTAQAGPYALEGPVPVADIIDMLMAQPDIIGLINPTKNASPSKPKTKTNTDTPKVKRTYILHKNGQATPLHDN